MIYTFDNIFCSMIPECSQGLPFTFESEAAGCLVLPHYEGEWRLVMYINTTCTLYLCFDVIGVWFWCGQTLWSIVRNQVSRSRLICVLLYLLHYTHKHKHSLSLSLSLSLSPPPTHTHTFQRLKSLYLPHIRYIIFFSQTENSMMNF